MQVLSFSTLVGVGVRVRVTGRTPVRCVAVSAHAPDQGFAMRRTVAGGFVPTPVVKKSYRSDSKTSTTSRSVAAFATDDDTPKRGGEDEPDRDEDGLYIGTYSNFFTDPDQLKGVVIFCAFLASFASLGNIGAAILLPILYGQPIESCIQGILFGYYCPP